MKDIKIYTMDYLMNEDLSEDDLYNLCDKQSLIYSLIIGEFREIHSRKSDEEIINLITRDNKWIYKTNWSKSKRNKYINKVSKVFHNIYQYGPQESLQKAQMFMIRYGISIK